MAPRKTKKEQAALCRAALEGRAAAQRATVRQEVSLSGEVLKDNDESMSKKLLEVAADALSTNDDENQVSQRRHQANQGPQNANHLLLLLVARLLLKPNTGRCCPSMQRNH